MEEFQENLKEALKKLQIADHMTYLTYPLINEKRILLKVFDEIFKSVDFSIRAVLLFESNKSEINLYKDNLVNMQTFVNRFSDKYYVDEKQMNKLREIYEINERHVDSPMEFVKGDKIVIMSDNLGTRILDIGKIKEYLIFAKELLKNINNKIKEENIGL